MNLDRPNFAELAGRFVKTRSSGIAWYSSAQTDSIRSELLAVSRATHVMTRHPVDPSLCLATSSRLFDSLAEKSWPDPFGERYETCLSLAFIGWRSALNLADELEAQEWLRVAEVIGREEFEAKASVLSFLLLDRHERSTDRFGAFVESGVDVFLALAILKIPARAGSLRAADAAADLVAWVNAGNIQDLSESECAYLCAELALVRTSCLRMLGLSRETNRWFSITRSLVRKMPTSKLLRAKLLALRIADAYRRHRVSDFSRRAARLAEVLTRAGMRRESLICRTAVAFSERTRGLTVVARERLEDLIREQNDSSEQLFRAVWLANLAELDAQQGQHEGAIQGSLEAIRIASEQGCEMILGTVLLNFASVQLAFGLQDEALITAGRSVDRLVSAGAGTWLAYARIWKADALIGLNRFEEARSELLLALLTVQREEMLVEGVHALKLLGDLEARAHALTGRRPT
jgi:tetratricopeptide (TPR) repeat protein